MLRRSSRSVLVAVLLFAAATALLPPPAGADATDRMTRALNAARERNGLQPVQPSEPLMRASASYARQLARTARFQHARSYQASGFSRVTEMLGVGYRGCRPGVLVRAWLRSPTHRGIMLERSSRFVGIGKASGRMNGKRTEFWVVRFGMR